MALTDFLTLRHNKYVASAQIWTAFCLAILAADYFGIVEFHVFFLHVFALTNWTLAVGLGAVGLYYCGVRLKDIERQMLHRSHF